MSAKISRRTFLKGAAAVLGTSALAACGAPAAPAPPPAAPKATTAPAAAAAAPKPTTAPAAAAPVEVRWSHWWGDQFKPVLPMDEAKSNTKIKEEIYPWGEYQPKILTQLAAGTAPDIIQLDASHHPQFYPKNIFVPFDEAWLAAGIDPKKWNVDQTRECGYNGKVLGCSLFTMQAKMGYVNLDLAKKAGYDTSKLPLWGKDNFDKWNWADFLAFMKAVTVKKSDGTYDQYGYSHAMANTFDVQYHAASRKALYVDDPWNMAETQSLITEPAFIQSVQEAVDMTNLHGVAPTLEAQQGVQGGLFRAGKAVSDFSWSNQTYLEAKLPFELGFIHLPYPDMRVHSLGANELHVNNKSKVIPQAQAVAITHTTDREVCKKMYEINGSLPAYEPNYYLQFMPKGQLADIAYVQNSRIKGLSTCSYCTENVFLFNRGTAWGKVYAFADKTLQVELDNALLKKKTVEQAMKDAKVAIDAEIKATNAKS